MAVLRNKSAIRLCAVDLLERVEGVVKSNIDLRIYQEPHSRERTKNKTNNEILFFFQQLAFQ